jgi:DNA-binding transcriptional MerR regulator
MDKILEDEELIPIGDVATTHGLTTRTLRYWEEMGLINSYQRPEGGSRVYTPYMVRRIKFIMKLKALGLTIRELQDLGDAYGEARRTDNMIPRLLDVLDIHIHKVDDKIGELSSLRKEIVDYRQKMKEKFNLSRE